MIMRRKDRQQDTDFALNVIDHSAYGVVAFSSGVPYCVPLSMVRVENNLYFHCAMEGTKLDLLRADPRVCVSFVSSNTAAEDKFTTYYQSANVIGTAFEVTDETAKIDALRALSEKLTPAHMPAFDEEVQRSLAVTAVWGIHIEELTGKAKLRK